MLYFTNKAVIDGLKIAVATMEKGTQQARKVAIKQIINPFTAELDALTQYAVRADGNYIVTNTTFAIIYKEGEVVEI